MQRKEPERGDPSEYAFGVKCSDTSRVKATQRRTIKIHLNRVVAKRLGFHGETNPCRDEKIRRNDERMFWIGIREPFENSSLSVLMRRQFLYHPSGGSGADSGIRLARAWDPGLPSARA